MVKAAQNVVVEIQYRGPAPSSKDSPAESKQQSVYVGWTGMSSQRNSKSLMSRNGARGNSARETEAGTVEIDATFGRMIGFAEGQKVGITPIIRCSIPTILVGRIIITP